MENQKFPKKIAKPFDYSFAVNQAGLYAIAITASCKSGRQVGDRGGEDLRVEIDGQKLREVPAKARPQYKDIPPSWNGTRLKGLKKTVVFLLWLNEGDHLIKFTPDNGAVIEIEPKIEFIPDTTSIVFNLEDQAEDGDRRPWITFVLVDLPLKEFSADISVKWRGVDSDDVKLIIDSKVKKNNLTVFHRDWLWSANIFKKLFQQERQKKSFKENLDQGVHYLEFWADRLPTLHQVELNLGEIEIPKGKRAKVVWDSTRLRQEPKVGDNILIEEINKGEEVVILEKAIQGERPKNIRGEYLLSDRWHKVQSKGQIGYIYSEALEIEGESEEEIQKIIIEKSRELNEDENLMLAIAEKESKFSPSTVGQHVVYKKAGKGIMQINDETVTRIREDKKINYNIQDVFDIEQNIEGGIRYFKYLRTLYQENDSELLEKALIAYNCGPNCIKAEDRDKPIDYSAFSQGVKNYLQDIKEIYERNKKKSLSGFIIPPVLLIGGCISILVFGLFIYKNIIELGLESFAQTPSSVETTIGQISPIDNLNPDSEERFYELIDDLDGNGIFEEINFRDYPNKLRIPYIEIRFRNQSLKLAGSAPSGYTEDMDKDNIKEVVIELAVGANGIWTEVYTFKDGQLNNIPVFEKETHSFSGFLGRGIKFIDYDNDGNLEVESFWRIYDVCDPRSDIYEYINGRFIFQKAIVYTEEEKVNCREAMAEFRG